MIPGARLLIRVPWDIYVSLTKLRSKVVLTRSPMGVTSCLCHAMPRTRLERLLKQSYYRVGGEYSWEGSKS